MATAVTQEDIALIQGDVIGVDYGAFFCLQHNIDMVSAIGDFDSVDSSQFNKLKVSLKNLIKLDEKKDKSDTEVAIEKAIQLGYEEVIILGVIGSRVDHFYAVLEVIKKWKLLKIKIINKTNTISVINKGHHQIPTTKKYFSLFAVEPSIISIEQAAYKVNQQSLSPMNSMGLSNQALDGVIDVTVFSGAVLLFESKDA